MINDTTTPKETNAANQKTGEGCSGATCSPSSEVERVMTDKFRDGNDLPELARRHAEELGMLRSILVRLYNHGYMAGHQDSVESAFVLIHHTDMDTYHADVVAEILQENVDVLAPAGEKTPTKQENE